MNEHECILLSIILNLAVDGKADLSELSPAVADYVETVVGEYELDKDDEGIKMLYWYAHSKLTEEKGILN